MPGCLNLKKSMFANMCKCKMQNVVGGPQKLKEEVLAQRLFKLEPVLRCVKRKPMWSVIPLDLTGRRQIWQKQSNAAGNIDNQQNCFTLCQEKGNLCKYSNACNSVQISANVQFSAICANLCKYSNFCILCGHDVCWWNCSINPRDSVI